MGYGCLTLDRYGGTVNSRGPEWIGSLKGLWKTKQIRKKKKREQKKKEKKKEKEEKERKEKGKIIFEGIKG